jgi:hypothetical protein
VPIRRRARAWQKLPTEELLDVRLAELDVHVEGSWLMPLVEELWEKLERRGVPLKPHVWVSEEWASPDGVPGIQVPFYLLHPRLRQLEYQQMHYVEGGSRREAMRLLRHESGHAIQNAWALQRRADFRKVFGSARPYPTHYRPNPASTRFVQHLPGWYAQSHPAEDFAETFAVWLGARARWRKSYEGWPALQKLEYVDTLVESLRTKKRATTTRARPQSLPTRKQTLREYYQAKQAHYGVGYDAAYDRDLNRLFSIERVDGSMPAATFVRRHRKALRESVARWTGQNVFTVDQIIDEIIGRCRQLRLHASDEPHAIERDLAILLTAHIVHRVHVRPWRAL